MHKYDSKSCRDVQYVHVVQASSAAVGKVLVRTSSASHYSGVC
jgi:hypothetical protein